MSSLETIMEKIANDSVKIGILGLGYVGLPLAVSFARKGLEVLGFEKSGKKIDAVNKGENYIGDISDAELMEVVKAGRLTATSDFGRIAECDAAIICVPTPVSYTHLTLPTNREV